MQKKLLLMTGASGLVGSRFIEMFGDAYEIGNIDLTTGVDILDPQSVENYIAAHPAETLIHLAAFTDTKAANTQTGDKTGPCYRVNVDGTSNITKACRDHNIYLIHVSTDFVFDGTKERLYVEEDSRNALEWYGETKVMAEQVVETSGVSHAIVRIAYPYRAKCTTKPDLITKIRIALSEGTLPPQFDDTTITPTFIDDIARAFDRFATRKPQGIFHCVGSTVLSPYNLAVLVAQAYDLDPAKVTKGSLVNFLAGNPRNYARFAGLSNTKASQALDLEFVTIEQGLAEVIKQQGQS